MRRVPGGGRASRSSVASWDCLSPDVGHLYGLAQDSAVQHGLTCLVAQSAAAEPIDGHRIDDMFLRQHAPAQRRFRVAGLDRNAGLDHARSAIELLRDEMHRDTV